MELLFKEQVRSHSCRAEASASASAFCAEEPAAALDWGAVRKLPDLLHVVLSCAPAGACSLPQQDCNYYSCLIKGKHTQLFAEWRVERVTSLALSEPLLRVCQQ